MSKRPYGAGVPRNQEAVTMKRRGWSVWFGLGLAVLIGDAAATAGDEPAPPVKTDEESAETEKTRRLNALIEKSVDWYELFADAQSATPLKAKPVFRWRN